MSVVFCLKSQFEVELNQPYIEYPKSGAQDPRHGTNLIGLTQNPRPRTPRVRLETHDSRLVTWDTETGKQDLRLRTLSIG